MIRLLSIPLSFLMAIGLFSLMAYMVSSPKQAPESSAKLQFNMMMQAQDSALERRQRKPPEPPEPPTPPELTPPTQIQPPSPPAAMAVTPLALDTSISGLQVQAPEINIPKGSIMGEANTSPAPVTAPIAQPNLGQGDQMAMPLFRVEPRYPQKALRRKQEGYVIMGFTIDTDGHPTEIKVLESQPIRLFDKEAIRALRQWKYQVRTENGVPVQQAGQTVKLEFQLAR